jgi:hypothetical protein
MSPAVPSAAKAGWNGRVSEHGEPRDGSRKSRALGEAAMDYDMEFGGGLEDIFYQIYYDGACRALNVLGAQDRATVVLITHNPHVRKIFDSHPHSAQIELRDLGY